MFYGQQTILRCTSPLKWSCANCPRKGSSTHGKIARKRHLVKSCEKIKGYNTEGKPPLSSTIATIRMRCS
eukprot:3388394-Amphidinium_carterae.1